MIIDLLEVEVEEIELKLETGIEIEEEVFVVSLFGEIKVLVEIWEEIWVELFLVEFKVLLLSIRRILVDTVLFVGV